MAFAIGFLLGSLLLLALVLYYTRIRNPGVPHAENIEGNRAEPDTELCEICENQRVCQTVGDLTICSACHDDLLA